MSLIPETLMARLTTAAGLVLAAVTAAPALAQQPGAPAQPLRIVYLNSARILANTPGRAQAESTFAREMAGARVEMQRMQAQLDSSVAEYQRTNVVMTPQARQTRETELRQMEQRTRQRATELDQRMQAREQELTAPTIQRVNAVIEGIRAEFNYSLIFDVAADGAPVIVTADRSLDISDFVIQRLQAAGPPPGPTPAAPADSAAARPPTQPAASAPGPRRPRP